MDLNLTKLYVERFHKVIFYRRKQLINETKQNILKLRYILD